MSSGNPIQVPMLASQAPYGPNYLLMVSLHCLRKMAFEGLHNELQCFGLQLGDNRFTVTEV